MMVAISRDGFGSSRIAHMCISGEWRWDQASAAYYLPGSLMLLMFHKQMLPFLLCHWLNTMAGLFRDELRIYPSIFSLHMSHCNSGNSDKKCLNVLSAWDLTNKKWSSYLIPNLLEKNYHLQRCIGMHSEVFYDCVIQYWQHTWTDHIVFYFIP